MCLDQQVGAPWRMGWERAFPLGRQPEGPGAASKGRPAKGWSTGGRGGDGREVERDKYFINIRSSASVTRKHWPADV